MIRDIQELHLTCFLSPRIDIHTGQNFLHEEKNLKKKDWGNNNEKQKLEHWSIFSTGQHLWMLKPCHQTFASTPENIKFSLTTLRFKIVFEMKLNISKIKWDVSILSVLL